MIGSHGRRSVAAIVCAGVAAVATTFAAEMPRLRPGQYERMTVLSLPRGVGTQPRKNMQCITAEDIKDFSKRLNDAQPERNCTVSDYKQSAAEVSYTQKCALPDRSSITFVANMTFPSDDTFRAVIKTSSSGGQAAAAGLLYQGATITVTAKRIGECTK